MALALRKATIMGFHSVAYFTTPDGIGDRVVVSSEQYKRVQQVASSIRPRGNSRIIGAATLAFYDTSDGFLQPGDYTLAGDSLVIQREFTPRSRGRMFWLDRSEWSGNPDNPRTLRANTITVNGEPIVVKNGVLQ